MVGCDGIPLVEQGCWIRECNNDDLFLKSRAQTKKAMESLHLRPSPASITSISNHVPEPIFLNVYGAPNWYQGMNSASLCSLAGRYDNPIPPRFLAPIDFLKISALVTKHFFFASVTLRPLKHCSKLGGGAQHAFSLAWLLTEGNLSEGGLAWLIQVIKKLLWNGHGYRPSHRVRLAMTVCILFCSWWECLEQITILER